MGSRNSKPESIRVELLTKNEFLGIIKLFYSLNSSTENISVDEKNGWCRYEDFKRHCEINLDGWLAKKFADKLSVKSKQGDELIVPLKKYINFVSSLLKGSAEEKVEVIWNLALSGSTENRKSITSQEIIQYIRGVIKSYFKCLEKTTNFKSWAGASKPTPDSIYDLAEFLLRELLYSNVDGKNIIKQNRYSKTRYTKQNLVDCFSKSSLLLNLHNSIISHCFRLDVDRYFVKLLPKCLKPQNVFIPSDYTLLDTSRVLFLNSQLPSELRSEWRYIFSTPTHGESFSKLMIMILKKGPTLIILKDEKQRVFGAFATHSWATGSNKFFGRDQSFFFHLSPKFAVYSSTGYNRNYQYLVNADQWTLPNGLGMGGKVGSFDLWIDAEFGHGKGAPTCKTFASPQLPANEEFSFRHLEVWGLGPEPKNTETRGF